ncbi:hypothetical protein SAMN05421868_12739 [Paenibacillus naphthalenovorans]|nr:hypothetical protein SAMN05421868_12739 [Paenibacillus naphthalenovorans]
MLQHEVDPATDFTFSGFRYGKISSIECYRFDQELTRSLFSGYEKKCNYPATV